MEKKMARRSGAALKASSAERLVYTVQEAGALIGLSKNSAYAAAQRGDFPVVRIGKLVLVPKVLFLKKFGLETPKA
jgi:excisionase family DNA binding protein